MISIFDLINAHQDAIVALVSLVLGAVETGVCSWSIHRLIMDEQFLIYIIGHAMYKKTKNLQEAMAHYYSLREFLQKDLFEVIFITKLALSIALVAGVCLVMASLILLFMKNRLHARLLWMGVASLSLMGLITGFGLAMKYLVQNILYLQVYLATTGVCLFLLLHLLLSLTIQQLYSLCVNKTSSTSTVNDSNGTETTVVDRVSTADNESQTASITLSIQEEFPLPLPPPSPPTELVPPVLLSPSGGSNS